MKKENQINYKKHKESWDNRTKKYCKTDSSKKYRRGWAKKNMILILNIEKMST